MRIRSTLNGGTAEVSDDYADRLIAAGGWEVAEALKPARKAPAKKATPKTKPAPKQEPTTEE